MGARMSEKQFPPSIRRLIKARKEGKVVKSRMVSVAISWWALILAIIPALAWVRNGTLVQWVGYEVWTPQVALGEAAWLGFLASLLIVGVLAGSGVAAGVSQTKLLFLPTQLLRGFEQYKPGAYFGRVKQGLCDSILGLIRCCFLVLVLLPVFTELVTFVPSSFMDTTAGHGLQPLESVVWSLYLRGALALSVIAAIAYGLARWRFYRQHKMSLQEMKDEYKEDEGDPHVKAHRKHEHRALLFAEVEKRVKRSKVVVVRRMTGGQDNN
jgi:flagellar biosynthesis protein FlhB